MFTRMHGYATLVIIATLILATLTPTPSARDAAPPMEPLRIGYATCSLDHPYQARLLDAVTAEAAGQGMDLAVRDAGSDPEVQLRQVEALLAGAVHALVVVPVDGAPVEAMVRAARETGTPLVFVNRNPFAADGPPENVYYVGPDSFAEGEAQMRFAGDEVGALGRVLVLEGTRGNLAARARVEGVRNVVSRLYPEVAVLAEADADWRRDEARSITLEWIDAFGADAIDAIVAGNDVMALGALDALEARGLERVVVVGVDALPEALDAIRDGRLAGTVRQDADAQATAALQTAAAAARNRRPPRVTILPSDLITLTNIESKEN